MYIHDLPYGAKNEICRILDFSGDWKDLAGFHMGFSPFQVEEIENEAHHQKTSPSKKVLTKWGEMNHNVLELYILLARMRNLTAMRCLKDLVHPKYHGILNQDILEKFIERERLEVIKSQTPESGQAQVLPNTESEHQNEAMSSGGIPLPIQDIEKGVDLKSNKVMNDTSHTTDNNCTTSNGSSVSTKTDPSTMVRDSASAIPMVEYAELAQATNNWATSNILGQGGFGVVFKGYWKNTPVAIKRLNADEGLIGESLTELRHLNSCRHDNVLPLYGYSIGGRPCLVYQLMIGGSLDQRLKCVNGQVSLKWEQRIKIAKGVACGLQFLHATSRSPLIHGDIKSPNILLDACGEAKIGDFGLARHGPEDDQTHLKVSKVHGTRPYLPDELLRGHRLSPAVDTYSFGVVLFELATALPAYDKTRSKEQRFLKDYVTSLSLDGKDLGLIEDRKLRETLDSDPNSCRQIIGIGIACTHYLPGKRPTMENVFQDLSLLLDARSTICAGSDNFN